MSLKDIVKNKAEREGFKFDYGTRVFQDYSLIMNDLKNGVVHIGMLPEKDRYTYKNGLLSSAEYSVFFLVSRKFESSGTYSNQDETYEQKHDNRLDELKETAYNFASSLMCANNWEAVSMQVQGEINQYSSNLDLINVELVFRNSERIG